MLRSMESNVLSYSVQDSEGAIATTSAPAMVISNAKERRICSWTQLCNDFQQMHRAATQQSAKGAGRVVTVGGAVTHVALAADGEFGQLGHCLLW